MRLRSTLLHIAQIVVLGPVGCGGSVAHSAIESDSGSPVPGDDSGEVEASTDANVDASDSAAPDVDVPEVACGGCGCGTGPTVPSGTANAEQACAIAAELSFGGGTPCTAYCNGLGNTGGGFFCTLPQAYVNAYDTAVGDDGGGVGPDGGSICPVWSGGVIIECGYQCTGRSTEGVLEVPCGEGESIGTMLAERARLEAVAIHAFATLERELTAHGAPSALLRDVRRARRDEIRHAAMMTRLARRFGATPRSFEAPAAAPVRALAAIAFENAVEGCVRETYGAVVGLIEARGSRDPAVRRAMGSIAADECRHAELAWDVAAWILPRLTPGERSDVDRAMRDAASRLQREGDRGIVRLLSEHVWKTTKPQALCA